MKYAFLSPLGIEDNAKFSISSVFKTSVVLSLQDNILVYDIAEIF